MKIRVLVADPPWQPGDTLPGPSRGAAKQYITMPTDEIMRFPLPELADDAILFLWRLASMQQDALDVCRAWGFRAVSEVVWNKVTKNGKKHIGMGRTVRASHETALVCVRGRSSRLVVNKGIRSTFSAPLPVYEAGHPDIGRVLPGKNGKHRVVKVGDYIHSAKPEAFFTEIVEPLTGGIRSIEGACMELFARKHRVGWAAVGNQLPLVA